jgi:hypothetical protein
MSQVPPLTTQTPQPTPKPPAKEEDTSGLPPPGGYTDEDRPPEIPTPYYGPPQEKPKDKPGPGR